MEQIKLDPSRYKRAAKKDTERGEIMDKILARLNPARAKKGYPAYTYARLGRLLKGRRTKDLYALLSQADDAEHRGNCSWGAAFHQLLKPFKPKI
jgi:hypothetical protein